LAEFVRGAFQIRDEQAGRTVQRMDDRLVRGLRIVAADRIEYGKRLGAEQIGKIKTSKREARLAAPSFRRLGDGALEPSAALGVIDILLPAPGIEVEQRMGAVGRVA